MSVGLVLRLAKGDGANYRLVSIERANKGIKSAPLAMDRKSICERLTKNWPPSGGGQLLKKMATPPWADKKEIKAIYAECRRISAETGVKHHVDHVIPLKGYKVCGLHTPANLSIIPMLENIRKQNKYEDGQ